MRMAGPDLVLFVVGVLLFAGATTAIVTTPGGLEAITGGSSPLGVYDVTYKTRLVQGNATDLALGAETGFDVSNDRVAKVVVLVQCSDPVPGSTLTLSVAVEGPNGLAGTGSGPCGAALEVPVEVASVPPATTVQGSTPEEARENVPEGDNATRARGSWTVTVTGARSAPVPALGPTTPTGSVRLDVEVWEPTLTPVAK